MGVIIAVRPGPGPAPSKKMYRSTLPSRDIPKLPSYLGKEGT